MAFSLAAGLYDNLTKESEFSVVLLGLENAGKTVSLLFSSLLLSRILFLKLFILQKKPDFFRAAKNQSLQKKGIKTRSNHSHHWFKHWEIIKYQRSSIICM